MYGSIHPISLSYRVFSRELQGRGRRGRADGHLAQHHHRTAPCHCTILYYCMWYGSYISMVLYVSSMETTQNYGCIWILLPGGGGGETKFYQNTCLFGCFCQRCLPFCRLLFNCLLSSLFSSFRIDSRNNL